MSFDFLAGLEDINRLFAGQNVTEDNFDPPCDDIIDNQLYYVYLMIPAVVVTLLLSFTEKRFIKKDCCGGRPALIYPQDVIGRSNRVSYAAAFGSIAYLCTGVVFYGNYAIQYTGPLYLKVFIALLSMIIYGVCYYPLFVALSLDSIPGYIVGILYAWTLTAINFARTFHCDHLTALQIGLLIIRGLPEFLCQLYLCISLPVRLILRIRRRKITTSKDVQEEARTCFSGIHVRKLFEKPKPPKPEPDTLKEKIISLIKSLPARLLYYNVPKFRYSGRVLSVFSVAFIIMYMVTIEIAVGSISLFKVAELYLILPLLEIGEVDQEGDPETIIFVRFLLGLGIYIVRALRASFLTAVFVAFVIGCVLILHSLSTYRYFLLELYKGKNVHLISKEDKSNASMLVGFMRYAGYQVAYIGWGYFVQAIVLFVVAMVITTVVILFKFGLGDWFIDKFNAIWPVLLTTLVVNLVQMLLARCVFLQRKGEVLALNNRRLFFIVVYFMFFYNIFLGLVSCLLRILKAILVGALFLPRLDHSTLPRRFQWFDPGFDAYCGFMYVESAHTNPVAITFIKMLKIETLTTVEISGKLDTEQNSTPKGKYILMEEKGKSADGELLAARKSRQARFRWQLAYTLLRNPDLLVQRKFDILNSLDLLGRMNTALEKEGMV